MGLDYEALRQEIEEAAKNAGALSASARKALEQVLGEIDKGQLRAATKTSSGWQTNVWVKQAILLAFRLFEMEKSQAGPLVWRDKIPLKAPENWRAVPGSIVRRPAYIAPDVVLMPSFVNIGAYVGEGSMVDSWATIGSCAQIGRNVHISGGAGIGGVLEPLQAAPVIIEDKCFIGARSEVAEGVLVEEGAVLGMGVYLSASTKIVDRQSGEIFMGRVPPYSVVVPGSLPSAKGSGPALYCAVIVKQVDARTRAKTAINELLRT